MNNRNLSQVDLTKRTYHGQRWDDIRTMAVDWELPKRERRECYTTEWEAKDRLGNTMRCSHESEGKYTQHTKHIKTKLNSNGEEEVYYEKGSPRDCYTLPWNKKTADSILTGEKFFGEDSINITNIAEVQYIVKIPYCNPYIT